MPILCTGIYDESTTVFAMRYGNNCIGTQRNFLFKTTLILRQSLLCMVGLRILFLCRRLSIINCSAIKTLVSLLQKRNMII